MKRVDFKKHSSVFYIGKGLIIASIVVTASLGFLVGFFVGKQAQPLQETKTGSIPPLKESGQNPQEAPEKEVSQQSDTAQLPASVQEKKPVQDQQLVVQQGAPRDSSITPAEKRYAQAESSSPAKTKQAQEIRPKQEAPEQKSSKATQDTLKPQKTPLIRKYTVQVGAFKAVREVQVMRSARRVGRNHLKMKVRQAPSGRQVVEAIGFNLGSYAELLDRSDPPRVDLACVPERNAWNGREILQLRIKDLRLLDGPALAMGA